MVAFWSSTHETRYGYFRTQYFGYRKFIATRIEVRLFEVHIDLIEPNIFMLNSECFKLWYSLGFKWILTEDFKFWIKSNTILTWNSLKSHDTKINYLWLIVIIFSWKFLETQGKTELDRKELHTRQDRTSQAHNSFTSISEVY